MSIIKVPLFPSTSRKVVAIVLIGINMYFFFGGWGHISAILFLLHEEVTGFFLHLHTTLNHHQWVLEKNLIEHVTCHVSC